MAKRVPAVFPAAVTYKRVVTVYTFSETQIIQYVFNMSFVKCLSSYNVLESNITVLNRGSGFESLSKHLSISPLLVSRVHVFGSNKYTSQMRG